MSNPTKHTAMFDGFAAAARRFLQGPNDTSSAYIALYEALNWAVALDARTAKLWAPRGIEDMPGWRWREEITGAEVLRGIRFARNAMHHDWAEVLELNSGEPSPGPITGSGVWIWRPLSGLPPRGRDDKEGEAIYREELEGSLVRSTLVGLYGGFDLLRSLLEPRGAGAIGIDLGHPSPRGR
jgi:hypothetical protein